METTYRYADGYYDRLERDFYGYARVVEEQRNATNDTVYRTITREFLNDSYYTKGLLATEIVQDAAGNRYTESKNTYLLWDINADAESTSADSLTETFFPQLVRTDQRFYEGQPTAGKSTYTTYAYDEVGNITVVFDAGDPGEQDDIHATIAYAACADHLCHRRTSQHCGAGQRNRDEAA